MSSAKFITLLVFPLAAAALLAGPAHAAPLTLAGPQTADPPTTSASHPVAHSAVLPQATPAAETTITFSEFPVDTAITDQYQSQGIIFGGKTPFITDDAANPTSPVLSGTPLFNGSITGTFVNPDGKKRTVSQFSLDVGYIDNPGSVDVTAYGKSGRSLTVVNVDQTGIVPVTVKAAGIASFEVAEISGDANGFAIDNVAFPEVRALVALGDSYSSGEGNPPFTSAACDRSNAAWPLLIAKNDPTIPDVTDIACSGATSEALVTSYSDQPPQLDQLQAITPAPDIVTITIGGNDVGFSDILEDCYLHNCATDGRLQEAKNTIENESVVLVNDYKAIQETVSSATVVVVGYPRLFSATQDTCRWLSSDERTELNELSVLFDQVEAAAAEQANVDYVSVLGALAGHELCTENSWVYPIGLLGGNNRGHPTLHGQEAIEAIVDKYLDSI
ncbi:MAG: SGNH/GDSL hydrolase family protein [Streptosporangiaceae bacterium]|jgi:lysophospholipase L1-like esterase